MNVEIAQRLAEMRRDKGFSQEELAEQLGLSRQAVSKWERAESSPDTGNLIALAKLYGVTLDDLLNVEAEIEDDVKFEAKDRETSAESQAQVAADKASAAAAKAAESAAQAQAATAHAQSATHQAQAQQHIPAAPQAQPYYQAAPVAPAPPAPYGQAAPVPPQQPSASVPPSPPVSAEGGKRKKGSWSSFPYPVVCAIVFFGAGFLFGAWHPAWVVFLTIPLYYWIANIIENDPNYIERHKGGQ